MKTQWVLGVLAALALFLGGMFVSRSTSAEGDAAKGMTGGPRYTVVETEGHNLIVTDNGNSTLYFYTIDKDAKIGSPLKLRGKLDLKQVGKPVITPSDVKLRD
jgi:hypothetical protein